MTREEAIKQVCDILYGYEDVPEAMYENACSKVRNIINQIDEPYTNDYDAFCNYLLHFNLEDMTDEQLFLMRNMVFDFISDITRTIRNRGL